MRVMNQTAMHHDSLCMCVCNAVTRCEGYLRKWIYDVMNLSSI